MTKLNWLSIGLLLTSALLMGTVSVSAQDAASEQSIHEQIAGDAGNPANAFGGTSQKPVVKDLYKSIYKTLKVQTDRTAIQKVANKYQYSETEMGAILEGNIGVLSRTQPESVKYQDLLDLFDKMREDFQKEFDNEQLKQTLFLDSYPQEIFVNGDTSDSGFDVVYDLEIIELLLFGDQEAGGSSSGASGDSLFPIIPAGASGSSGDGSSTGGGFDSGTPPSSSTDPESSDSSSPDAEEDTDSTDDPDADSTDEPTESAAPDPYLEEDGSLNPLACVADDGLQNVFREAAPLTPDDGDDGDGDGDDGTGDDDSVDGSDGDGDGDSGDAPTAQKGDFVPPYMNRDDDGRPQVESDLAPQESSEWADAPNVCNDIFCLEIRFTNRPDAQYEETANCIQCHVQFIVETLRETTSQSLSPGKVSGNLMEPSSCKKSLFNSGVSLNFIPIAMPIKTPGASELVTGVDLAENFGDFAEDAWGVDFAKNADPDKTDGTKVKTSTRDALNDEIKYKSTISNPGYDQLKSYQEALANYDSRIEEIERKFKDSYTAAQFDASTDFYQGLKYEMDQMSFYFQSFRAAIELAQEVAEQKKNDLQNAS
jgi:hypothetical protein